MAKYEWDDGPATLGPHSIAKHTILREYIEQYIHILTRGGTIPNLRLTLIDGFAGGGEYVVEGQGPTIHDGSPLVLIGAVQTAIARLNAPERHRNKPVEVDANFIFVEKNKSTCAYLKDALERRHLLNEKVRIEPRAFEEVVDGIIDKLRRASGRKPRPIFVLDQYGYTAIPVDMISKIMTSLPTAEIFLTLAVDNIAAHASTAQQALYQLRKSLHIDPKFEDFFAGRKSMDEAGALSEEERGRLMLYIQRLLHDAFAKRAGARCYTPFFITSRASNRSYWFLHLAHDSKANDVVKSLHWKVSNHFKHYGGEGTGMLMLGFDPAINAQQLPFDFGDSARDRTVKALVAELPAIIQKKYHSGVTLKDLYDGLCNEIPASKEILGDAVNLLCVEDELVKAGGKGEDRENATKVKDSDVIRMPKNQTLFSHFRAKK